jgi:hypothetical protein
MNIIEAIRDPQLFRPFVEDRHGDISSWRNWLAALRVLYGLPVNQGRRTVVQQCTGRDYDQLPEHGFDAALLLVGRRSGKSRVAALIGAFEAVLAGHEVKLAKGEQGLVAICAPTKSQSRIVKGYLRAIFQVPLLANEVVNETQAGFELRNGNRVEILTGDFRTVRGFTTLAFICDEIAFFGLDDEAKVKSDTELIRAIKPSLATVGGKLVAITSPYARRGWCFKTYQRNFGAPAGKILVWNCGSRLMNPTLPQSVVDDALAEDPQSASAEFLGQFRDDSSAYLPREVVERLVVQGRSELLPQKEHRYFAFCDISGGRGDDAALSIAHREGRKVVIDLLRRYRPPFNPYEACTDFAHEIQRFKIRRVTGDNYSAEFVSNAFLTCGVHYTKCAKPKSMLYVELLPRLCSGEIELLDDETLVTQLASLERRTRSGGRDVIDHPPKGHDDLANAVAGVCDVAFTRRRRIGVL